MADNQRFVQAQSFTLAGAGATIGDTTITLTSFQLQGVDLAMTDFGTKGWGTLEPGNGDNEEQISFTGVTQNANGTATLTGVKNVGLKAPYTETSGILTSHAGGVKFVISNTAGFYDALTGKNNDETITGTWTFTTPNFPAMNDNTAPISGLQLVTKNYVDNRSGYWEAPVANYAALPTGTNDGETRVTLDDSKVYVWNGASWVLAGSGGGAGTIYVDYFIGSQSTGGDLKTFTLTSGSFPADKYLTVYRNGALMANGSSADYTTTGGNAAVFNYEVLSDDVITLRVESIDFYNPAWTDVTDNILPDVNNTHTIGSASKSFASIAIADVVGGNTPVGSVLMYSSDTAPTGWLLCDGASVLRASYPALFAVIGTTYGSADGTHFNTPDMRGRVPVGYGAGTGGGASGTGAPTGGSALTARAMGAWTGEETHALTEAELAAHTHGSTINSVLNAGGPAGPFGAGNTHTVSYGTTSGSAGSGTAHNTVQPVMTLNFIIKT